MKLLVFQHSLGEPPAAFSGHARAHGDEMHIVHLYRGDPMPDPGDFTHLLAMGGPMNVWEHGAHPWLREEKDAIRAWVSAEKPYLGICLGHQLLASAMGGDCSTMARPEIGVCGVTLPSPERCALLAGLPDSFPALHWHGVEVIRLADNGKIWGASKGCKNQVMQFGTKAWGLQFHPEIQRGTISEWMLDPSNLQAATAWLGSAEKVWEFVADAEEHTDDFIDVSTSIYAAFRAM